MTAFAVHTSSRPAQWGRSPAAPGGETEAADDLAVQLLDVEELSDGRNGWRLAGEIDLTNRELFNDLLAGCAHGRCDTDGLVHFDLAGLKFIDLAGTRSLVRVATEVNESNGRRLALHHPPYTLLRVATLLLGAVDVDERDCLVLPASS